VENAGKFSDMNVNGPSAISSLQRAIPGYENATLFCIKLLKLFLFAIYRNSSL
jgi:hypothetical protein